MKMRTIVGWVSDSNLSLLGVMVGYAIANPPYIRWRFTLNWYKPEKIRQSSDVLWLIGQLKKRKFPILHKELKGKHLEPLGVRVSEFIVDLNPFDKFIEPLKSRQLEDFVIQYLDELRQRQNQLESDLGAGISCETPL